MILLIIATFIKIETGINMFLKSFNARKKNVYIKKKKKKPWY